MFSTRKRSLHSENTVFSNKTLPSSPSITPSRPFRKQYTQNNTPRQQPSHGDRTLHFPRNNSQPKQRVPFEQRLRKLSNISNLPLGMPDKSLRQTDDSVKTTPGKRRKISIDDFLLVRPVGRGKNGVVFLAVHRATGFVGALKVFSKSIGLEHSSDRHTSARSSFIRELKIHSFTNHNYIIQVYSIFDDDKHIYLFMELGVDGQLFDRMQPHHPHYREQTIAFIAKSLLSALQYLHSQKILHRDLKPQNIVLIHGYPKICDFGESNVCDLEKGELRETLCGTPLYLSPEILQGQKYNQKIDIWALGALSYQLFTGTNPFNIQRREDLCKIITHAFQMTEGSIEMRNFVGHCLKKSVDERPTAIRLLRHPFIRKWQQLETSEQLCT